MSNKLFLIAIDDYKHQSKLNSCVKDVTDVKTILLEKYNFEEKDVYELYNNEATNLKIQDALSAYVKTLKQEDNLVVYYSGHGYFNERTERGFWIPYDGKEDYTTWIANETIISILGRFDCKHIFLISDSCFSNSLLLPFPSKSILDYSKYNSRWALTSAFHKAYDSEVGSNSFFAESIIKFLENAQTDFRVSSLIEDVKQAFSANVLQMPQGSPLMLPKHRGGEFVFTLRQDIEDKRNLKGYNNFFKILQLYRRNSKFTELKTYEDKTKRIGFQVYIEYDDVLKKSSYYLYLYAGHNQVQTYNYLKDNFPQIFRDKNLIVFLSVEKDESKAKARKYNITRRYKPLNIFFIDEFIRKQCTPKIINEDEANFLNISNFILPSFSNGVEKEHVINYVDDWFNKEGEPILVVKGTGGIGKTTFAQYIADEVIKRSQNATVLFIDSIEIKDNLLRNQGHKDHLNIYNFYEALYENSDKSLDKLNEDLFKINIDAGNILIVIDGLDEVISKIPNFNVEAFLKSINDSSDVLGGGKVIITCRTHFWDQTEFTDDKFAIVELEPFNIDQTNQFFKKSFDSESKVRRGLKLANEFRYPGKESEHIFHPYVLDIIRSIITSEAETIETDLSYFSSSVLKSHIKNDYIIFRICDRERKRVGQITVDEQVKFFIFLATEKRGVISTNNFRNEIEDALNKQIDKTTIEAFKSHPFLKHVDRSTTFKYDFLADLFKSIYIAKFFDFESGISDSTPFFVDMISENCWYGSAINADIVNRVVHWSEDDALLISDIIGQISKNDQIKVDKRRKTVANIFNLCLLIAHKFSSNNIDTNTRLLKQLFEKANSQIKDLCIININTEQNVRFDFSSLVFTNCYVDNFSSFWDCLFDQNTKFYKCYLLNLKARKSGKIIPKEQFVDCTYDKDIEMSFKSFDIASKNNVELTKEFLSDFFHLFFSNGRLGRQWEDEVIKPRYAGINKSIYEYKKTIRIMKRNNVLRVTIELGQNKFSIEDAYKEDVTRFIKDGTPSDIINKLIKEFVTLN